MQETTASGIWQRASAVHHAALFKKIIQQWQSQSPNHSRRCLRYVVSILELCDSLVVVVKRSNYNNTPKRTNLHGIFDLQQVSIRTKDGNGAIVRHDGILSGVLLEFGYVVDSFKFVSRCCSK